MAAVAAPRAPRAMTQREASLETISFEAIFHNAAKKLYPRLALFETLAKFKDGHRPCEQSGEDIREACRDFLDSFAYLCDIEKGGAYVTAAGLQKLPHSNFLWLAANEGVARDVKIYAENILRKLKEVQPETQKAVQNDVFQLAVTKCNLRIVFYKSQIQKHARNCRMQLKQAVRDDTGAASLICHMDRC